jgi:preprotein translocase subunit SecB
MTAAKKKKVVKRGTKKPGVSPGLLVSDRVQIRDVRLMSCGCEQKPAATAGKKSYDITTSTDVRVNEDQGLIVVIARFHFEASSEKKPQEPVLTTDASFVLTYQADNFDGLTQEGFEQFANLNGVYNAWPYWREFVQNTIGRMGLPPLTIPVFRIVEPSSGAKTAKKTKKKSAQKAK